MPREWAAWRERRADRPPGGEAAGRPLPGTVPILAQSFEFLAPLWCDSPVLLVELSMSPLDKGPSVSKWVARSLEIIDQSGLDYRLGPMGTCIEGEWDQVLRVVRRCWKTMSRDSVRISFSIKGDWRRGKAGRLSSKVEAVEKRLGRKLKT